MKNKLRCYISSVAIGILISTFLNGLLLISIKKLFISTIIIFFYTAVLFLLILKTINMVCKKAIIEIQIATIVLCQIVIITYIALNNFLDGISYFIYTMFVVGVILLVVFILNLTKKLVDMYNSQK